MRNKEKNLVIIIYQNRRKFLLNYFDSNGFLSLSKGKIYWREAIYIFLEGRSTLKRESKVIFYGY